MREASSVYDKTEHPFSAVIALPDQRVPYKPLPAPFVIGRDIKALHPAKEDGENIPVLLRPDQAVLTGNKPVAPSRIESGGRPSHPIPCDRILCLVSIAERILHPDDRIRNFSQKRLLHAPDPAKICEKLSRFELKLRGIFKALKLAAATLSRNSAGGLHPIRGGGEELYKSRKAVVLLQLQSLGQNPVSDESSLYQPDKSVPFSDPESLLGKVRDREFQLLILLHLYPIAIRKESPCPFLHVVYRPLSKAQNCSPMVSETQSISRFAAGEASRREGREIPSVTYCGGEKGSSATSPFHLFEIRR